MSGRYRAAENSLLTKHVVAAGTFAKDAGSTPAASTSSLLLVLAAVAHACTAASEGVKTPCIAFPFWLDFLS